MCATAAYLALAGALTWPLPRHLTTHFPGSPSGDLGVYVWNLWVFGHEVTAHRRLPLSTEHVFAYTGGADFTLHNYAPLAGLAGMPLIPWLGLVATFNVLVLAALATSGLGVYMLARRSGMSPPFAWLAGALFMASPAMTARTTAHFSLLMAAPIPVFAAVLLRALDQPRWHHGIALGALVAAATYADAYYGVFCVLIGAFLIAWRLVHIERRRSIAEPFCRLLDGAAVALSLGIAWRIVTGPTDLQIGALRIGLSTLYNPLLALLMLVGARLLLVYRARLALHDSGLALSRLTRIAAASVGVTLVLLAPMLMGLLFRAVQHRLPQTPVFWRSSPRGVDALAYLIPNPAHPLIGRLTGEWLMPPVPDAYPEFVAAFPVLALLLIGFAMKLGGVPRMWTTFTGLFVLLSLGPFIHVAGVNTMIVGPWALLRYLPIVGMARSPARFAIVAALGLSMLAGFALQALRQQRVWRTRFMSACVVGLALELLPWPRPLFAAGVPEVYGLIATTDDERGRVLELPTGIRDGTSSVGNSARALPLE